MTIFQWICLLVLPVGLVMGWCCTNDKIKEMIEIISGALVFFILVIAFIHGFFSLAEWLLQ